MTLMEISSAYRAPHPPPQLDLHATVLDLHVTQLIYHSKYSAVNLALTSSTLPNPIIVAFSTGPPRTTTT